jgi:hypothetical protein
MVNQLENMDAQTSSKLSQECIKLREVNAEIEKMEEILSEKKAQRMKLTDEIIPSLMEEIHERKKEFNDGTVIEIKPFYGIKIDAAKKPDAFTWLRSNNHGDLIKNQINVSLGMAEDTMAKEVLSYLKSKNLADVEHKTDVHSSTLKAWFKEQVEKGRSVPGDLFNTYVTNRASIKTKE